MRPINFLTLLPLTLLIFGSSIVEAQQILLDKPTRAGQLTCFPELNNEKVYYYLPDKIRIGRHEDGTPIFSFLKYVENVRSGAGEDARREGDGGGIVHAVVELSVPKEMLDEAQQAIRKIRPDAVLQGPVVYKGGTIALITALNDGSGNLVKKVVGLGKAPILDNQKAAVSILLTKQGAKILWESFKTPTPALDVSFEMEYSGFRSPIGATIEANFDQVYEHSNFRAAAAVRGPILLSGEINQTFEDLQKSGAIKVTQYGSDPNIEKAVDIAYTKLTNMMFDPAGGTGTPSLGQLGSSVGAGQPSLLDRVNTNLTTARQEAQQRNDSRRSQALAELNTAASSTTPGTTPSPVTTTPAEPGNDVATHPSEGISSVSNDRMAQIEDIYNRRMNLLNQGQESLPSISVAFSYEMKKVRQRGMFRIDLNKYNVDNVVTRFDYNLGGVNSCKECFREVNLDDPLYVQREVVAYLDGANSIDFDKFINTVTVTMRKTHENKETTLDEVRIDRKNFNAEGNNFKLLYGWKGDNNRRKWFDYEYKTDWFFFGGYEISTPWAKTSTGTIPLSAPFIKRDIFLDADPDLVKEKNVRSIEVKIYSKVGELVSTKEHRLNIRQGQYSGLVDILQTKDTFDFEYEILWYLNDGSTKNSGRKQTTGTTIFVDTL